MALPNKTVYLGSEITTNRTKRKSTGTTCGASQYPELTCRVCLQAGDIPIFGDASHSDISRDVRTFGCVVMDECDGLPKYLCDDCFALLEAAKLFREKAQGSDGMLRSVRWSNHACEQVDMASDKQLLENVGESDNDSNNSVHKAVKPPADFQYREKLRPSSMKKGHFVKNEIVKPTAKVKKTLKSVKHKGPINNSSKTSDERQMDVEHDRVRNDEDSDSLETYELEFLEDTDEETEQSEVIIEYDGCDYILNDNAVDVSRICLETTDKMKQKCVVKNKVKHSRSLKSEGKDKLKPKTRLRGIRKRYVPNAPALCDECGYVAKGQYKLNEHKLIHTNEFTFHCKMCPYRGKTLCLLRVHERSHSEPRYKCSECPMRCTTAANLKRHKRQHMGPGEFTCETCKRHFYTKLEMERHVLAIHFDHRPFECDLCSKKYGYRKLLTKHRRRVHKVQFVKSGRLPLYMIHEQEEIKDECA